MQTVICSLIVSSPLTNYLRCTTHQNTPLIATPLSKITLFPEKCNRNLSNCSTFVRHFPTRFDKSGRFYAMLRSCEQNMENSDKKTAQRPGGTLCRFAHGHTPRVPLVGSTKRGSSGGLTVHTAKTAAAPSCTRMPSTCHSGALREPGLCRPRLTSHAARTAA